MTSPCLTCGNRTRDPVAERLNAYACTARRLPNPEGELEALPNKTLCFPEHRGSLFGFAATEAEREARLVERTMGKATVEGWRVMPNGERAPFAYTHKPCPAWRIRADASPPSLRMGEGR